jgi:hypothetical protein
VLSGNNVVRRRLTNYPLYCIHDTHYNNAIHDKHKAYYHRKTLLCCNLVRRIRSPTDIRNEILNFKQHNQCKYKGVSYYKKSNQYQAQIVVNGVIKYLGLFLTAEQASDAYQTAAKLR